MYINTNQHYLLPSVAQQPPLLLHQSIKPYTYISLFPLWFQFISTDEIGSGLISRLFIHHLCGYHWATTTTASTLLLSRLFLLSSASAASSTQCRHCQHSITRKWRPTSPIIIQTRLSRSPIINQSSSQQFPINHFVDKLNKYQHIIQVDWSQQTQPRVPLLNALAEGEAVMSDARWFLVPNYFSSSYNILSFLKTSTTTSTVLTTVTSTLTSYAVKSCASATQFLSTTSCRRRRRHFDVSPSPVES